MTTDELERIGLARAVATHTSGRRPVIWKEKSEQEVADRLADVRDAIAPHGGLEHDPADTFAAAFGDDVVEVVGTGGRQSPSDGRFDLIPTRAVVAMARVVQEGAAKHGEQNWRGIPSRIHVGRALRHLLEYLAGDRSENHLSHAFTRIAMAFELASDTDA